METTNTKKQDVLYIREAIQKLTLGEDLSYNLACTSMEEIMNGLATPVQMSAFLVALSMKGETIDEITACAKGMRNACKRLLHNHNVLEIVGTGGDRSNTFNISTTSAILVSSVGVPVAKHGNRAASSRSGAADVLEALGINITINPSHSTRILDKIGLCFLFAQNYHLSMKYVAPVRKELSIKTIFNILGPLTNPAGANMELLGVYDESLLEPLAQVLANLGVKKAMVVYGQDHLDEISLSAPTSVCEVQGDTSKKYVITPDMYGFEWCKKEDLIGGTPEENAIITRDILSGSNGPKTDAVLLNSAAALYLAKNIPIKEGVQFLKKTIQDGIAIQQLDHFIRLSNMKEELV